MLTLDLPRLEREWALSLEASIPSDDPLWDDSGLVFDGDLVVEVHASVAGTGEFVVRANVEGSRLAECRRCLEGLRLPIRREFVWVFGEPEEDGEEGSGLRPVAADAVSIDLGSVLREELLLELDQWGVCRPDCKGLCPHCGGNRNETMCDCSPDEPDPRWDALRALESE
jgi:uncharacterized protein